jgi:hypothetical protein
MDMKTSPSFPVGTSNNRELAHMQAVRARRAMIEASYRADGFSESHIAAHVTDALAEKMLAYDRQVVGAIMGAVFGGAL